MVVVTRCLWNSHESAWSFPASGGKQRRPSRIKRQADKISLSCFPGQSLLLVEDRACAGLRHSPPVNPARRDHCLRQIVELKILRPMSATTYRGIRDTLGKLEDSQPWLVGFSGGKDSTIVASLDFETVPSVPEDLRKKPVRIVCIYTRVEIPSVADGDKASEGLPVSGDERMIRHEGSLRII